MMSFLTFALVVALLQVAAAADACPAGTHLGADGSCRVCPLDTYQPDATSSSACLDCPAGTKADYTGSAGCNPCPANTYWARSDCGRNVCRDCPCGQVSPFGATTCVCPAGTQAIGATCQACPPGTFSSYNSTCQTCAPGMTAAAGATWCQPCPLGTQSAPGGLCTACGVGEYSLGGMMACAACNPGSFANTTGTGQCTFCSAGQQQTAYGGTSCSDCPENSYNDGRFAAIGCQSCFNAHTVNPADRTQCVCRAPYVGPDCQLMQCGLVTNSSDCNTIYGNTCHSDGTCKPNEYCGAFTDQQCVDSAHCIFIRPIDTDPASHCWYYPNSGCGDASTGAVCTETYQRNGTRRTLTGSRHCIWNATASTCQ